MIPNPNLYRELDIPFESQAAADAALAAFWNDLAEIRRKHKIPDLVASVRVSYASGDGEAQAFTSCEFGDVLRHEAMAAHTFGQLQAERQERIGKLAEGGGILKRRAR